MKVYGWQSFHHDCPPAPNGSKQVRKIVAAGSKAEAKRLGADMPLSEIAETGNKVETAAALAHPGIIFWRPLDAWDEPFRREG